jgi:hypothetical protein
MKNFTYKQNGDALLMSLIMLLLMTLSFFALIKIVKNDSFTSGALTWHSKGKQVAEVSMSNLMNAIKVTANGRALEYISTDQIPTWYRVGAGLSAPSINYWATCNGNTNSSLRCNMITNNGFNIYEVVQSTGITASETSSLCSPLHGIYYKIYLHTEESSKKGSSTDTETVYRLCV